MFSHMHAKIRVCPCVVQDLTDQLWESMQAAGSMHAQVVQLKGAMVQREAEIEAIANKKVGQPGGLACRH